MNTDYSNIEGLIEIVYNEGYKHGYNAGTASHDGERGSIYYGGYGDGHKDGLNDAWECVKKISNMDFKTRKEILGVNPSNDSLLDIVNAFSPSEAIAKIKEHEEKQKEANDVIKVGDEVVDGKVFNFGKGIVTFASPLLLYVLWYDGSTGRRKMEDVKKTGRTFPKITEILEQLKKEEEK